MKSTRKRETGARTRALPRAVIAGGSVMALSGLGLAVAPTAPAGADHGQRANSGILNTTWWRVCPIPYDPNAVPSQAVNWAIALWDSNSELTVQLNCSDSNVLVSISSFPDTFFGNTWCEGGLDGRRNCRLKRVELNQRTIDAAADPGTQWKKTACHEIGHVGGLGEGSQSDSCMRQGAAPPIPAVPNAHDHAEIENTYPR